MEKTPHKIRFNKNEENRVRKAILVVSFGTSYKESREAAIGAVEKKIAASFQDYEVRRAFTSQVIINKLAKRDGEEIENVKKAMDRLLSDGFDEVVIQPTHIIDGYENETMTEAVLPYVKCFRSVRCGKPLLAGCQDYKELAVALEKEIAAYDTEHTAVVWMGHGTGHGANAVYTEFLNCLRESGRNRYFIGTVEAAPGVCQVIKQVGLGGYTDVLLHPLMIVSGDHAHHDMAGEGRDSWKNAFESAGFRVKCIMKGLGEYGEVQKIFVRHVLEAIG